MIVGKPIKSIGTGFCSLAGMQKVKGERSKRGLIREAISQRVLNSAYKRVIHKERRDIVHKPKRPFKKAYEEFQDSLKKLRHVVNQIHTVNHTSAQYD